MSTHTPGPWTIHSEAANAASGSPINSEIRGGHHVVVRLGTMHADSTKANARLIAAAPDLLAALQAIYGKAMPKADYAGGKATHYLVPKALVDAARAAIAKAEETS